MNARITKTERNRLIEQTMAANMVKASQDGFVIGSHMALKLAVEGYAEDIRNANTYETLREKTDLLLAYLENRKDGLKKVLAPKDLAHIQLNGMDGIENVE